MWAKRNEKRKYGNSKVEGTTPGHWFDSKSEKALHTLLSLRERAGEISALSHHPGTVHLTEAKIGYRPDFSFIENGETIYAEMKGFETEPWRIKKKLWTYYGPGRLQIWKQGSGGPILVDTVSPKLNQKCKESVEKE